MNLASRWKEYVWSCGKSNNTGKMVYNAEQLRMARELIAAAGK